MPTTGVPKTRVGAVVQSYINLDNAAFVGAQRESSGTTYTVGPMSRGGAGGAGGLGMAGGGGRGGGGGRSPLNVRFTGADKEYKPRDSSTGRGTSAGGRARKPRRGGGT